MKNSFHSTFNSEKLLMYVCVYMCVCVYIYTHTHTHTHTHTQNKHIHKYIHTVFTRENNIKNDKR
jgi:hypothetical protein